MDTEGFSQCHELEPSRGLGVDLFGIVLWDRHPHKITVTGLPCALPITTQTSKQDQIEARSGAMQIGAEADWVHRKAEDGPSLSEEGLAHVLRVKGLGILLRTALTPVMSQATFPLLPVWHWPSVNWRGNVKVSWWSRTLLSLVYSAQR